MVINNRSKSNSQTATKAEPKLVGRAQADLDVVAVVEAEETTVGITMQRQRSQGKAKVIDQAAICIRAR